MVIVGFQVYGGNDFEYEALTTWTRGKGRCSARLRNTRRRGGGAVSCRLLRSAPGGRGRTCRQDPRRSWPGVLSQPGWSSAST